MAVFHTARSSAWVGVVACLLVLGACGGGGEQGGDGTSAGDPALPECPLAALDAADGPVEVTVWHSLVARQKDTVDELAARYNASQDRVEVRMENVAGSDEELLRRFQSALPSRDLPSVFVANDTMTQTMIDSGVALPAQSCVDAAGYDLTPFAETVRSYYTVDGVLWAASANPGSALVFYNKDHYRRAGLDPERPPGTLAELRAHAEAIRAAGIVDRPLVHEVASYKTEFWLTGARAPIVDHDNGRAAPASEGALSGNADTLALFEWFAAMDADGLLQPIPVAEGQVNQYLAMANGQASVVVESSSAATSVEAFLAGDLSAGDVGVDPAATNVSGLDVGAGAFPGLSEPGRTQMGGPAWYIMATSPPEAQAAAWDFLTFMNGEEAQTAMLTGGSFLPYRRSAAQTPEAQQFFDASLAGGWLRIADGQVETIDPTFPGPLIGPYDEVRDILRDALTAELLEDRPPAEVIADADTAITERVRRYAEGGF
jgi:sn-glycerol 3-phosphate transport system substrate-binding protein